MLALLLTTLLLVAVTVAIHAFGTIYWIRYLGRHYAGPDGDFKAHKALSALIWSAVVLLLLHLVEVLVWALSYVLIMPSGNCSPPPHPSPCFRSQATALSA